MPWGTYFSTTYESFDPAATPAALIDVVPWRTRRLDHYQSIADTIVQLFRFQASGVIALEDRRYVIDSDFHR